MVKQGTRRAMLHVQAMLRKLQIWRDRRGRVSGMRVAALAFLLYPVALALWNADAIVNGARPLNDVIHRTGYWMLIFLLASLAITPLRRITRIGGLIDVRRMIGVGAFFYGAAHITLYAADQMFDLVKVASEIVLRVYLTVGFAALAGLAVLAATSTDGMVRRLGALRWQRLHYAVYGIGVLALIHYFQQTKADVSVPTFTAGVFVWLMGYRIAVRLRKARGELPTLAIAGLSVAAAALVFIAEAIGLAIKFDISPLFVLETDLDFSVGLDMISPGWLVLAAGLAVTALDLVCARLMKPKPRQPRPAPRKEQAGEPARAAAG
jgi:methionine sulfoxide reductase heme-binding subunit